MPRDSSVTCDECGMVIGRRSDLRRHKLRHASNKEELKYPCTSPGCGKAFLQYSNLKTHMNTHNGEKPHGCPDCISRFADPSALLRHRAKKHGHVPQSRERIQRVPPTSKSKREHKKSSHTSSSSPDEESVSSGSSIDTHPDSYETPRPMPEALELSSSSLPPADCYEKNAEAGPSLPTLVHTTFPVPPLIEQHSVPLPPIVDNDGYTLYLNTSGPSYVYDTYALDNTPVLSAHDHVTRPSHASGYAQTTLDDIDFGSFGYAANEALFYEQFLRACSFAIPDTGVYSQGVGETYQYPTEGRSGFPTQEFYYHR